MNARAPQPSYRRVCADLEAMTRENERLHDELNELARLARAFMASIQDEAEGWFPPDPYFALLDYFQFGRRAA